MVGRSIIVFSPGLDATTTLEPLGPTPYRKSLTGLILSLAVRHAHPADRRLIAQFRCMSSDGK